ncbi:hypothetical protein ACS0TY_017283 [Phlomoides rotata]
MREMMSTFRIIIFTIITLFSCLTSVSSQSYDYPTANLSTLWITGHGTLIKDNRIIDSPKFRIILHRQINSYSTYACCFYCDDPCDSYLLAVLILRVEDSGDGLFISNSSGAQIVWSANRNNRVGINSTLELTGEGDLVLRNRDGTLAWSTNTAGRSVARLSLTEMGNLVLLDANSSVVWQSFDHPTDCLVPGQILKAGTNLTENRGLYSVLMTEKGLVASIQSDPPQVYYQNLAFEKKRNKEASCAKFQNGSLDLYITKVEPMSPDISITIPKATSPQYIKLGDDGHLRVFEWVRDEVADIFTDYLGDGCGYPMACGEYGICSVDQCSCPSGSSFRPINDRQLNQGCSEVIPLMCNATENHTFLDMDNITYFAFTPDIVATDMASCKDACLKNCSCKAAIFNGRECYMPSQVFSFIEYNSDDPTVIISIKVQSAQTIGSLTNESTGTVLRPVLGSTLGVLFVAILIGTAVYVYRRRRRRSEEMEEDYLDHVPGMPTRFSLEELVNATDNFNKKLGEGGFGSVFEGSLNDGTRIAVKSLDGVGHIKKSFLAEVQSIGSIHHINLVRLIGFCAEKSHRLLVYAYMCNGSLERWIYCKSLDKMLEWSCRRKIILDIAKGLAYLHEDCLQKIIHLDIKPQNILLDERFNAKLGDFGLSKLIDRDQSNVVTTMRGTPGYLAPEWLKSAITEKVDVYSFGVVILEIVCGRKIFEQWRPEEERHLPTLFMKKAEEGLWVDLVDKCCQDVESNVAEVEEMMQISALCLQSDPEKRPSMSMVVKILEGVSSVQKDIDYNLLISQIPQVSTTDTTTLLPSLLSGPR